MRSVGRSERSVKARRLQRWKPLAGGRQHGGNPRCRTTCAGNGRPDGADAMPLVSLLFHDVYRIDPRESGFCSPGADRYKLSTDRFAAQLDGVAAARDDSPILATDCSFAAAAREFPFVITVDDGGSSYRQSIADELELRGWRGHAFVSTDFVGRTG